MYKWKKVYAKNTSVNFNIFIGLECEFELQVKDDKGDVTFVSSGTTLKETEIIDRDINDFFFKDIC